MKKSKRDNRDSSGQRGFTWIGLVSKGIEFKFESGGNEARRDDKRPALASHANETFPFSKSFYFVTTAGASYCTR